MHDALGLCSWASLSQQKAWYTNVTVNPGQAYITKLELDANMPNYNQYQMLFLSSAQTKYQVIS